MLANTVGLCSGWEPPISDQFLEDTSPDRRRLVLGLVGCLLVSFNVLGMHGDGSAAQGMVIDSG